MRLRLTLLLGVCALSVSALAAQEEAPAAEPAPAKSKMPFALFVEVDRGTVDADTIDSSFQTLSTHTAITHVELTGQTYARAAIGWKLPHGKGDFRLRFTGYREEEYSLTSTGFLSFLDPTLGSSLPTPSEPLRWWTVNIDNGVLHAERTPPQFAPGDDTNGNNFVDPGEQSYLAPDITIVRNVPSDLQNRAQTWDALYGRVFGNRRATARWWGGLRYFEYQGTIPSVGWMSGSSAAPGAGFSDGALIPLLALRQDSKMIGPTGAMEVRFHFFDQRLSLFLGGQVAFGVLDVSVDSGPFSTYIATSNLEDPLLPVDARLKTKLNKSSWQPSGDAGVRYTFRNGLELELAYQISGFLDVILLPDEMAVPASEAEVVQGTSALYRSGDYVLDGWRGGLSFQF